MLFDVWIVSNYSNRGVMNEEVDITLTFFCVSPFAVAGLQMNIAPTKVGWFLGLLHIIN